MSLMIQRMRHRAPNLLSGIAVLRRWAVVLLFLPALSGQVLKGQTGGDNTYEFLNLSHSAFANATGGINVASRRSDLTLPYFNPALLDASMDNDISLSFSSWFAGIRYGYASWAHSTATAGNFAGGISFISYGTFTEAACNGTATLYVRRDDWPEQDCLIDWLEKHARCAEVGEAELKSGTLQPGLERLWQQPQPTIPRPDGAAEAAERIAAYLP